MSINTGQLSVDAARGPDPRLAADGEAQEALWGRQLPFGSVVPPFQTIPVGRTLLPGHTYVFLSVVGGDSGAYSVQADADLIPGEREDV